MTTLPHNTALILVDVQQAFNDPAWGQRNNPQAEANIARLLARWRAEGRPLFHIQHSSRSPNGFFHVDQPGHAFKPEAMPLPGETIIKKQVNSSFIGTDLEQRLRTQGIGTVVIAGITTDHCVSTTTRMAGNFGFETYIVADACATFERKGINGEHFTAEQMHATALASVHGEFATAVNTADIV